MPCDPCSSVSATPHFSADPSSSTLRKILVSDTACRRGKLSLRDLIEPTDAQLDGSDVPRLKELLGRHAADRDVCERLSWLLLKAKLPGAQGGRPG